MIKVSVTILIVIIRKSKKIHKQNKNAMIEFAYKMDKSWCVIGHESSLYIYS